MAWDFDSSIPIYLQIIDIVKAQIASGQLTPGGKMPSVRDMAVEFGVNPNTMQKALSELERDGLVYSQRTSGRFVTEDVEMIKTLRNTLAHEQIDKLLNGMLQMGYQKEELIELIEQHLKEMK